MCLHLLLLETGPRSCGPELAAVQCFLPPAPTIQLRSCLCCTGCLRGLSHANVKVRACVLSLIIFHGKGYLWPQLRSLGSSCTTSSNHTRLSRSCFSH
jgi:hypothetical protein